MTKKSSSHPAAAKRSDARFLSDSKAPTILQVLPALHTGGVERGTADVAAALVRAGWGSIVVSSGGPMVHEIQRNGATHITLPVHSKNPITIARNVARIKQVIAERGVSLVHARSRAPAWSAMKAARAADVPFVTTFHGTYSTGFFGAKNAYNRVMVMGDRVIAISRFIANHITETYHADKNKIRIIHRGVDTHLFSAENVSPDRMIQLARRWRIEDAVPVVMLPGRLTRWKGQAVLIKAMALLNMPTVRVLLVGSDQGRTAYREELEALAIKLGVRGQIHFTEDCNDMPAAYTLASVVVSASTRPEAFGRVVAEAQAMGRPVIAPNHGGAPEILDPGVTGWLVPPNDPVALCEALKTALDIDPDRRDALASQARENMERDFSKQTMLDNTMAVYKELLYGAPPLHTVLSLDEDEK